MVLLCVRTMYCCLCVWVELCSLPPVYSVPTPPHTLPLYRVFLPPTHTTPCIECSYPPHTLLVFYMKGADTVMASIVQYNDWLDEEVRENTETDIECL